MPKIVVNGGGFWRVVVVESGGIQIFMSGSPLSCLALAAGYEKKNNHP